MTGARAHKENEGRQSVTLSLPPAVVNMIPGLQEYPGQRRSDIVLRLIVEADRKRRESEATA